MHEPDFSEDDLDESHFEKMEAFVAEEEQLDALERDVRAALNKTRAEAISRRTPQNRPLHPMTGGTTTDDISTIREALAYYFEDGRDHPRPLDMGTAALDRLEARIAELEQQRDDLEEIIESRDMRIKELGDALAALTVREIHAQQRVRELEAAVDLAIAIQNERVDELDIAHARIEQLEIRDKMRDDGEHALLAEIENRDARIAELEAALREIAAMDIATWYDGPSAGFAAVARRALGEEGESRA